jgi:60 kDa SS-A/Ro ribonucleoprotein
VIDSPRMLRSFVQIVRSGAVGRKSLGTVPKRLIQGWLASRSDAELLQASVGAAPSLADVLKLVHPRPASPRRAALYGYLLRRPLGEEAAAALPDAVRELEAFKRDPSGPAPDVPFQLLTALPLGSRAWADIARRASWQTTRMNLNTFLRHGVFDEPEMEELIAGRLRDPEQIARARALPYQLLIAAEQADGGLPARVRQALDEAMEIASRNVPEIAGRVFVLVDVSGSMVSPITGHRKGAATVVRCVDVAALMAAALLRKNRRTLVLPFATEVWPVKLSAGDSVAANARKLARLLGGGTDCSAPLARLNERRAIGDLVVYVSDNQSWVDARAAHRGTATLAEWQRFRQRNPRARLVCIDLQPYGDSQAPERDDVTNVGGFSDQVFQLLADVGAGRAEVGHWVRQIESVPLEVPAAGSMSAAVASSTRL